MADLLPVEFQEKMKELLGDEFNSFLSVYEQKHNAGLRVNTLKLSPEGFEEKSPVPVSPVPWVKNGFYYDEALQPAKHPYYYAGLYYIQEPSAMTPASLLPVRPGDKVLDICAAPGGKSTELGAKLCGKGVLVSNDISNSRAKALLKNVELFGIRNGVVISDTPAKLSGTFEGFFDKILVDAPCSGEGMFRKSHAIIKNWEQYGTGYYAKLQREILPFAINMLKPGGMLLYSTCTFSSEEDEGTLKFILDNFPDMHVIPAIAPDDMRYKGFAYANPMLAGGQEEIANALRLYPHRIKGEGHFVALLRKDGPCEEAAPTEALCEGFKEEYRRGKRFKNSYPDDQVRRSKIAPEVFKFLERIGFEVPLARLCVRDDRVYMMPEGIGELRGLRVMRSGLLLGEIKKDRFEPSQALACALHSDEYDNIYDLPADSQEVIKYLKCETIEVPESVSDGYVLVCADGYALGWGKVQNGRFKNKYLPGWRLL